MVEHPLESRSFASERKHCLRTPDSHHTEQILNRIEKSIIFIGSIRDFDIPSTIIHLPCVLHLGRVVLGLDRIHPPGTLPIDLREIYRPSAWWEDTVFTGQYRTRQIGILVCSCGQVICKEA